MTVKTHTQDNQLVIQLPEKFDFDFHNEFRKSYTNRDDYRTVLLDMKHTQYMDSSALGMMLQLREAMGNESVISIKNVNPSILNVLKIAKFDSLFSIS